MTEFVSPGSSGNQLEFLHPLFELWADPAVQKMMMKLMMKMTMRMTSLFSVDAGFDCFDILIFEYWDLRCVRKLRRRADFGTATAISR